MWKFTPKVRNLTLCKKGEVFAFGECRTPAAAVKLDKDHDDKRLSADIAAATTRWNAAHDAWAKANGSLLKVAAAATTAGMALTFFRGGV